jgi:hypothetical protein
MKLLRYEANLLCDATFCDVYAAKFCNEAVLKKEHIMLTKMAGKFLL